jgi:hypothetical protein
MSHDIKEASEKNCWVVTVGSRIKPSYAIAYKWKEIEENETY